MQPDNLARGVACKATWYAAHGGVVTYALLRPMTSGPLFGFRLGQKVLRNG
ncbi:MAG: hypothetical protein JNL18_04835 [Planctomycetaceae bacterium]|nr:hypothetical protein [Planctomycetaceae bacterium]